jgi:hypothetical protein
MAVSALVGARGSFTTCTASLAGGGERLAVGQIVRAFDQERTCRVGQLAIELCPAHSRDHSGPTWGRRFGRRRAGQSPKLESACANEPDQPSDL